jgi:hypothetical protein
MGALGRAFSFRFAGTKLVKAPPNQLMRFSAIIPLATILIFTGCSSGTLPSPKPQTAHEAAPKFAQRVKLVMYEDPVVTREVSHHLDIYDLKQPDRPFKEIALLTCEGAPKEEAPMTEAIFYRAKQLGADAVLSAGASMGDQGGGFIAGPRGGFGMPSGTRCVFRARAIIYTEK